MAEVFVSPGVYTQEIDDTFVPAGAGTIGAALIGRTTSGPAYKPVQVSNFGEFIEDADIITSRFADIVSVFPLRSISTPVA